MIRDLQERYLHKECGALQQPLFHQRWSCAPSLNRAAGTEHGAGGSHGCINAEQGGSDDSASLCTAARTPFCRRQRSDPRQHSESKCGHSASCYHRSVEVASGSVEKEGGSMHADRTFVSPLVRAPRCGCGQQRFKVREPLRLVQLASRTREPPLETSN